MGASESLKDQETTYTPFFLLSSKKRGQKTLGEENKKRSLFSPRFIQGKLKLSTKKIQLFLPSSEEKLRLSSVRFPKKNSTTKPPTNTQELTHTHRPSHTSKAKREAKLS